METAKKNSILIVDDDNLDLEILNNILSSEYTVYTTKNGSSAITMADKYMPDLILLDIVMPDMDGYEVLAVLKSDVKTQNIPIIIITGLSNVKDEEKGLALQAADFIHKPFSDMIVKLRVRNQMQIVNQINALNATEEKSRFFAKMSHEMRTPLNAVIGLSEMILEEGGLSEEARENIEKISSSGSSLLSLVNDILDISKIEAGKFELVCGEYDTSGMINDTVTQSIMRKEEKPIEFILNIDESIPAKLYGDDLRIKQIFNNLLSNAFKYTREGTVEFSIKSEIHGKTVMLIASVRDTGIGIKKENISYLFSDFSQIDLSSNRKIEGTGLGLSITKMITDMMNGQISVESEYGVGSTFTVKLPQKKINDEVIGPQAVKSLKNFRYHPGKKGSKSRLSRLCLPYAHVLVVDDVPTNLDVARGMMKPYRMKIDCLTNGQDAIDAVREEKVKYNAIFMDHMMPGMDGVEAVRIIREEIGTEYAKNIPIIALTANALAGSEEMFLGKGFQAFVSKPIDVSRLDAVIRQWVRSIETEKLLEDQRITIDGETFLDPRTGSDRRVGDPDRRKGYDRRLFEEKIEGIDLHKGLKRFGGDIGVFLDILKSFSFNTRLMLDKIKDANESDLSNYAITVHGIKSSCRGICAEEAGNQAEALEAAAKAGSFDFVKANNQLFIETVLKLIAKLETVLEKGTAKKKKPKKDKPYMEALLKLKDACENYQIEEIDAAIKEIECFDYTNDDGLALWLRENIDQMNYPEIAKKIAAMM